MHIIFIAIAIIVNKLSTTKFFSFYALNDTQIELYYQIAYKLLKTKIFLFTLLFVCVTRRGRP